MKPTMIIAQNAMGKTTLAKGVEEWLGSDELRCNFCSNTLGRWHDVINWTAPTGPLDHSLLFHRCYALAQAHDVIFLINTLPSSRDDIDPFRFIIVVYDDWCDGAWRWMARDPSFFKDAKDAIMTVRRRGETLCSQAVELAGKGHDVTVLKLQPDQFLIDVIKEVL